MKKNLFCIGFVLICCSCNQNNHTDNYTFVDHSFANAEMGAAGVVIAE